jgi:pimeloyl-ACP methyl ester carboxylesterase
MKSRRRRIMLVIAAALLMAVLLPTCARYRRDVGLAYDRIAIGSQIAQSRCGPVEYATEGAGPPILVVHGAGGGFDQGLELGKHTARAGFRTIAVSRFGYLRSPVPRDASAAAQADAYACLLDALNVRRVAVLGVSAGGPSSLQFALHHADRTAALVLLVPAAYAPSPNVVRPARMSRGLAYIWVTVLRSNFAFWAGSKLVREQFIRSVLGTPPEVTARASAGEQARLQEILDQIMPVSARRQGLLKDAAIVSTSSR